MIFSWALVFLLAAVPKPKCYGDGHNAHRSTQAKRIFMNANPCPGGPDRGKTNKCHGYVIDHICPLACCGADSAWNMQWQTHDAAKEKDKWELDCRRSCKH